MRVTMSSRKTDKFLSRGLNQELCMRSEKQNLVKLVRTSCPSSATSTAAEAIGSVCTLRCSVGPKGRTKWFTSFPLLLYPVSPSFPPCECDSEHTRAGEEDRDQRRFGGGSAEVHPGSQKM